jgi:AraC family transcriptional regulator of adaptative response / DNA-3-methyladenine glycosylase II
MASEDDIRHAAIEARDPRFDGRFYVGVTSTGIYCRTICRARTPKRENRRFFASAAAAESAGFRPCLLCRPELAPGLSPLEAPARLAAHALQRIEAGALEEQGLEALAADLGVTSRHLRRAMKDAFGASPIELAQTARLLTAKHLLADTDLPIAQVAFASGFQSLRRFNDALKTHYALTPSRIRRARAAAPQSGVVLRLSARGAFLGAPSFEFLARRAAPGMEAGDAAIYARTLRWGALKGWLEIEGAEGGLRVRISESLTPALRPLIAHLRFMFDLDADLEVIDAHLARDARFASAVSAEPGLRIIGALDGFELAARAVLGQQVTVAGARTLTGRLITRFGEPVEGAPHGLSMLFPNPEALAAASLSDIAMLGMPKKRAETLQFLAKACVSGAVKLTPGAIAAGRAGVASIPGIGPWTIEYIALRALGDPDAFPFGDAALNAVLGRNDKLEALSPWRAYATLRAWRMKADTKLQHEQRITS